MRILQLINWLEIGGAEKLVTDLVTFIIEKKGYKCDVMVLGSPCGTIFEKMLQDKGIRVIYLGCRSMYSVKIIFRLARYFKNYDIVHVHLFPAQLWAVLAKLISGNKLKFITTEHSTNNRRRGKRIFRFLDRFIYNRYDAVISISKDAEHTLLEWLKVKEDSRKYRVVLNGVNIAYIDTAVAIGRSEIGVPANVTLVMCIGRLESVKNHRMQLEALSLLDDSFHLVLVGDGSLRSSLEAYASELGVNHRVYFTGIRADVPSLIRMADIAILTSHWEGLSLACVEGMACCPFIGTDVNGIRDVVQNAGILVADSDAKALAGNIQKLVQDHVFYKEIKIECRTRAEKFDINEMVEQYLVIFNNLRGDDEAG